MTDTNSGEISRREQLRALVRVAKYGPVFTAAIIGAGVFAAALEAVGLSFIVPIVESVQSLGDPAQQADGVMGVFVSVYQTLGIPFITGFVMNRREPCHLHDIGHRYTLSCVNNGVPS